MEYIGDIYGPTILGTLEILRVFAIGADINAAWVESGVVLASQVKQRQAMRVTSPVNQVNHNLFSMPIAYPFL